MKKGFLLSKEGQDEVAAKDAVDLELKKAFADLQVKMQETRKGIRQCELQKESLAFESRKAQLTKTELLTMPPDTVTYQTMGRMFVKQGVSESIASVEASVVAAEETAVAVETRKAYLQSTLKDAENNLRELITSKQKQKA